MNHFPRVNSLLDNEDVYANLLEKQKSTAVDSNQFRTYKTFKSSQKTQNVVTLQHWQVNLKELFPNIHVYISALQLKLCDLAVTSERTDTCFRFFILPAASEKSFCLSMLAMSVFTIFPSTYLCESLFSKVNFIKNDKRSCPTNNHLKDSIRVATCDVTGQQYKTVMSNKAVLHTLHWLLSCMGSRCSLYVLYYVSMSMYS